MIIFISGFYHLCDTAGGGSLICIEKYEILRILDVILTYTLFATYILNITRLNIFLKILVHVFQIWAFVRGVIYKNIFGQEFKSNYEILWCYALPAGLFLLKIMERIYKKKIKEFIFQHNFKNLFICCILLCISIIFGPILKDSDESDYWFQHSLLWHIPIMLSSFFIIKVPITDNNIIDNNIINYKTINNNNNIIINITSTNN
jgi:hypothetical protein